MKNKKKILFLSCGLNSAYHAIKILKEKYKNYFYLIGADCNSKKLVASSTLLDKFYKVAYSNDSKFYSQIIKILDEEKIDIIFPIFDFDQKIFNKNNPDLHKRGILTTAPKQEIFNFYGDKLKLSKFLKENKLPTPKYFLKNQIDPNKEYFLKPKEGVGSVNSQILIGKKIKKIKEINKFIIQELCEEPEYTTEVFYYKNIINTVTRERIETKAGICTKTCVFKNIKLEKIVKKLIQKIEVPNCFNLQFMKNNKNEFVITDVNFRLAGGMGLSYKAGWDEISALADTWLEKSEKEIFSHFKLNCKKQWIVRVYEDIITKSEQ